jgi:hypothetical protein
MHWKRKERIEDENDLSDSGAIVLKDFIIILDLKDETFESVVDIIDHEYLHSILLRTIGIEACEDLDNLEGNSHWLKNHTNYPLDGTIRKDF